jgi:hypothetical protein
LDFETTVKLHVYTVIAETTRVPRIAEVATALTCAELEVKEAFLRLRQKRLLYLEPDTSEIRMAPPFSAVPTGFLVRAGSKAYDANCVWDAYGVAAALHCDVTVEASCGDCGEPLRMEVRDFSPVPHGWAVHFAVPAAHWWDDLVFA